VCPEPWTLNPGPLLSTQADPCVLTGLGLGRWRGRESLSRERGKDFNRNVKRPSLLPLPLLFLALVLFALWQPCPASVLRHRRHRRHRRQKSAWGCAVCHTLFDPLSPILPASLSSSYCGALNYAHASDRCMSTMCMAREHASECQKWTHCRARTVERACSKTPAVKNWGGIDLYEPNYWKLRGRQGTHAHVSTFCLRYRCETPKPRMRAQFRA